MSRLPERPDGSEFLLFQSADGAACVQVRLYGETVWLTQAQMAELFNTTPQNITQHIRSIFEEGELSSEATCKEFLQVRSEGARQVQRNLTHYNLDVIISVGYRVRSHRGTQFRIWATQRLREYLVKGFVLDDERLKEGRNLGADYFQELLERIRDIRASERRFYQKVTDIYATAIDYDKRHPLTQEFYATVQNKLHWAIHGQTAAELIADRVDASQPNMGLTTWKQAPGGPIRREDVKVAKNFLNEDEIRRLNRLVTQYLDFAESMAERRRAMTMADWKERLDAFLQFNELGVLDNAGRVSHEEAVSKALGEFEKWTDRRRALEAETPTSDFDQLVDMSKELGRGE
ncbi:MAG: virulence RhuM family protein [Armatimonadetes bacterium]|nr:virulence RhuM family protein [Armatimonadota bacterium]